ncbi:uncharacterized protein LOC112507771 isoform X2 [Cynara cardunculus var. scolymus]|uniref:uncharacterized protein LOC112507771 isoform X2 n=1 Tax=Cynara cardunculus var. scolymus TaxID=59895 RepID=UPI000D62EFC9|nr:uncharacterized protein LOC112507771 isoform X2 [Cynara cardunculus var. scolymus]
MGAELFRKYVSSSVMICYRSVVKHPFLVGMGFLLILMYRLFPLLFSLLVSASPVIVSTAVLLGTLLSFGQPNIPEIEKESKSDRDEIQKLETKVMGHTEIVGRDGSFASVETNGSRIEIGERTSVNDDPSVGLVDDNGFITEEKSENLQFREEHLVEEAKNEMGDHGIDVDEEKDVLGSHYTPLQQSESDDKLWEGSADPLNSDSGLLWKRMEGDDSEDDEGSDSGSDLAESSSPDASMADIIPMLDELHPLLAEESETRESDHISTHIPAIDAVSEHSVESSDSSSESHDDNDDGGGDIENHEDLEVGDDEDKESKHTDKEDEIRSVITWTEYDQKNLMNLGTSELERNRRLENLIARRRARKTMRMQAEKNLIDLESSDIPWNIPPISTTRNNPFDISYDSNDNVPGSAPSVLLQRRNPFDLPYDPSEEKPDLVGDTFQQEFAAIQPKEPFFRRHESFNVGPSIFGASRSERQETKLRPYFVPERIASDGTSFSTFQRQLSELSDSKVTDTESISSAGDLENKGHIEDDLSLEPEPISEKEHEHVSDDVIQVTPYFVPEQVASAFHRQMSELSDSKVSSIPDTESISSDGNLENKDPIEDDLSQEAELISVIDHEHPFRIREHLELISTGEHAPKANEHVSEHVSSEDDGNVESIQVEKEDNELDEAEISVGNLTSQQEVALHFPETENVAHLNLGGQELHSSASSLSSSYEVSDQIYDEKEDDEMPTSVAETDYYFMDRGNSIETSDITSLLVEESQPKEPIYDSSPRGVTKNLSSSSISTDLQTDVIEKGQSLPNSERTSSVSGRESQETVQKTETDCANNDAEFVDSSEPDAAEEIESRSITDNNLIDFQHAEDQHQESSFVADLKWNSTDSSSPETRDTQNQIPAVPDNEEPLSAGDSISTSLLNKPLFETEDGLLDMDAYHQLEQVEVPPSNYHERFVEGTHQEEVISQPEESSLLGRSMEKPSAEDHEELQGHELDGGHFVSSNSEVQSEEVVHGETYENPFPTHHQFESEEEAILQPHKEFPSANKPSEENPEVLQIQEPENNISPSINCVLNPETDVVEVAGIETKAPETLAYTSDVHSIESKNTPNNVDDVDEINEIDENLLVELDAVGDFSFKGLGSTSNEMKEDQHASEHDLENKHSAHEDSYSNDLGSILNEMKQDPHASELDLEDNPSVDEDSYSKNLGSTLNEMKQDPHGLEHDPETNSYSKDLGSTLNEMKQDPHASEHDLETNSSMDLGSVSNEMIQDPHALEHDLQTNPSVDEDSYIEDLKSGLNEMKQEPRASGAHSLETFYSVDENAFIKDIESTLSEIKQDPRTLERDHSTDISETKIKTDAEERTKAEDEKEISNTEVEGASEASSTAMVNHVRENVLSTSNTDDKE